MAVNLQEILLPIRQCGTCAVEYDAAALPDVCPICSDERQYLPEDGVQRWSDPARFEGAVELVELESNLWGVNVNPGPGIGQQAKIVVTPDGCVMFDVPAAITQGGLEAVRALGPMRAIIASHPHMFGLQSAWSAALGGAPVYVAQADRHWLGRTPEHLRLWNEPLSPIPNIKTLQVGGHFPGSSVLHWTGEDGRGVLLAGDSLPANPDGKTVSFMRSYPNRIPLSAAVVRRIADAVKPFSIDRTYNNFDSAVKAQAGPAIQDSADRYIRWVSGANDHLTGPGVNG